MTWPTFNLRRVASASYEGDARLIIWTLAWDNHAVLSRAPLFESNIFYPAPGSLSYNEHLFGISVFSLPVYAVTGNPVLAYNLVWFVSWIACALCAHALLRRYAVSDLAAFVGSLIFTFSFYKMLQGHGHLQQIWTWPLPLSLLLLERWIERPSWARTLLWWAALVLGLLGSWYLAVMVALANGVLLAWRAALDIRAQIGLRIAQLIVVAACAGAVVWPFARHYGALAPVPASEVVSLSADLSSYVMPAAQTWPGQAWLAWVGRGPGQ